MWCGWRFNFAYETVELCAAKREKLRLQIQVRTLAKFSGPI